VHRKYISIYIQQDATLHSLFYLETVLHVSGGTSTYHQKRKQLYLQHLVFVTPLLLTPAIVEELELIGSSDVYKKTHITNLDFSSTLETFPMLSLVVFQHLFFFFLIDSLQ